jgi:hypothetical protein
MVTALAICKILDVRNRAPARRGALFARQPILDRSKVKDFGGQNDPKFRRLVLKEAVFDQIGAAVDAQSYAASTSFCILPP